jgi:hypothetical protein
MRVNMQKKKKSRNAQIKQNNECCLCRKQFTDNLIPPKAVAVTNTPLWLYLDAFLNR